MRFLIIFFTILVWLVLDILVPIEFTVGEQTAISMASAVAITIANEVRVEYGKGNKHNHVL